MQAKSINERWYIVLICKIEKGNIRRPSAALTECGCLPDCQRKDRPFRIASAPNRARILSVARSA